MADPSRSTSSILVPGSPNLLDDPPCPRHDAQHDWEIFTEPVIVEDSVANVASIGCLNTLVSWDNREDDSNMNMMQNMNEESSSLISLLETPEQRYKESLPTLRFSEPPVKVRRINVSKTEKMNAETYPICLKSWVNSSDHKVVALKCGHLFGSRCIETWLKSQPEEGRSCPSCKSKATLNDLRFIYARRVVAVDTTQIRELQKKVDFIRAEKCKMVFGLMQSRIAHKACEFQLEYLRTLMRSQVTKEQPVRRSWRFALEKNLIVCKDSRTYNSRKHEVYI